MLRGLGSLLRPGKRWWLLPPKDFLSLSFNILTYVQAMKIASDEIMKVLIDGGLGRNSKRSDVLTSSEEVLMLTQPMC